MPGFDDFFQAVFHRVLPKIFPAVLVLSLIFSYPCSAMQMNQSPAHVKKGKSAQTAPAESSPPATQSSVENVFVDKIEDGAIYSKDGRKFDTGGAIVVDNTHKKTGTKAAELFFRNGALIEVILK